MLDRKLSCKLDRREGVQEAEELADMERLDAALVHWPDNLRLADLTYFLFAPTLCYELNFPRTERVRKFFLLRRLAELLLGLNLMLAMVQQWMVPNVRNSLIPFNKLDWALATERVLKLSLPNHIVWLCGFYIFFHSFLNTLGEVTHFADRDFYQVSEQILA